MSDYQGYPGQQPPTGGWATPPSGGQGWAGPAQGGQGWAPAPQQGAPAGWVGGPQGGSGWSPGGQPGQGTPGQPYGTDQYSGNQYGGNQYGAGGYGHGQYGPGQGTPYGDQPGYGQGYGPGHGSEPGGPGAAGVVPPPKKRTALVVTVAAVVVAVLAATGVWYFGFRDSKGAGGGSSPQEAANAMLVSLSQKDPVGVADQLAPSEAKLVGDLTGDVLTELKRLQIVTADANQSNLTGATVTVSGLTYDPNPDQINDHVSVVKLTGGTVTITSDPTKVPLTDKIKQLEGSKLPTAPTTKTYNIADEVAKRGGPIRIATVLENGKWYPSVFYTAADMWAQQEKLGNPTAADLIPAAGGDSPEATMDAVMKALSNRDVAGLIALLPPDEMGVLHDYGQMIVRATGTQIKKSTAGADFAISNTSWNVTDTTGGKLVSIKSLTATVGGTSTTITRDGDSLTVAQAGKAPVTVSDSTIDSFLGQMGSEVDPTVKDIIKREFHQVLGIGFVVTQSGGKWYFSPLRSYAGIFTQLLKGLQPGDIDYFISKAGK